MSLRLAGIQAWLFNVIVSGVCQPSPRELACPPQVPRGVLLHTRLPGLGLGAAPAELQAGLAGRQDHQAGS